MTMIALAGRTLLDWLVPRDCLGCSIEVTGNAEWCCSCAEQLEPNSISDHAERPLCAPWHYAGPLRRAIHCLKYGARPDYAGRLVASGLARRILLLDQPVALVPVPLHPGRIVERGYNQSALLARALGQHWRLPVFCDLLARRRYTKPQVGQSREERSCNVQGAFVVRVPSPWFRCVWLVDDVITTGATTSSCIEALALAGIAVGGMIALGVASATSPNLPDGPADPHLGSQAMGHFHDGIPSLT